MQHTDLKFIVYDEYNKVSLNFPSTCVYNSHPVRTATGVWQTHKSAAT